MKLSSLVLVVSLLGAGSGAGADATRAFTGRAGCARQCQEVVCGGHQSLCADKKGHEAMMCLRSNPDKVSAGLQGCDVEIASAGGRSAGTVTC